MDRHEAVTRCYLIPGWMWPSELCWLYDTFSKSRSHAEIGSFCGRSLFASCGGMAAGSTVYSIDSFCQNSESVPDIAWLQTVAGATQQAIRNSFGIQLEVSTASSTDVATALYRRGVRLDSVFIDACHEYAECSADIECWRHLIKPGGICAGHDYSPRDPGVMDAVNEAFEQFEVVPGTRIWHATI
jgi:hypothetical protein